MSNEKMKETMRSLKKKLRKKGTKLKKTTKERKQELTDAGMQFVDRMQTAEGRKDLKKSWRKKLPKWEVSSTLRKEIAISLGVILLVSIVVYFTRIEFGGRSVAEVELDIDQQIGRLTNLKPMQGVGAAYAQGVANSRKKEIDALRQQEAITPLQEAKLDQIQLAVQRNLVFSFLNEGVDCEAEKQELEVLAVRLIDRGQKKLSNAASYVLCATAVKEFCVAPNEDSAAAARNALAKYQNTYLNIRERSTSLITMLAESRKRHSDNGLVTDCVLHLGNILGQSEDVDTRNLGRNIGERNLFGEFNLATLENRIRLRVPGAIKDLQGVMAQLRKHPDVMPVRWHLIIRACESFVSISEMERFKLVRNSLSEIAASISGTQRKEIEELLRRQDTRVSAVGETFDISGVAVLAKGQIQDSVSHYAMVTLIDQSQLSMTVLRRLADNSVHVNSNCTPIIAFKPGKLPTEMRKLRTLSKNLLIASEDTSKKYHDQLPIDFYPECILVDANGKVVATHLLPVQVAATIKSHQSADAAGGK